MTMTRIPLNIVVTETGHVTEGVLVAVMASDLDELEREAGGMRLEPMLGLATTRELLEEIAVRMKVTQNSIKGRDLGRLAEEAIENLAGYVLGYSTVGPYPEPDPNEPTEPDVVGA